MASTIPSDLLLGEFGLFPNLPAEIRLHIWRKSLPGPRIVRVDYKHDVRECRSSTTMPIALQVCQESREEALLVYKLAFGPRSGIDDERTDALASIAPLVGVPGGKIYFNFKIDTFLAIPDILSASPISPPNSDGGSDEEFDEAAFGLMDSLINAADQLLALVMNTADLDKIRILGLFYPLLMMLVEFFVKEDHPTRYDEWYKSFSADCRCYAIVPSHGSEIPAADCHNFTVLNYGENDDEHEHEDGEGDHESDHGGDEEEDDERDDESYGECHGCDQCDKCYGDFESDDERDEGESDDDDDDDDDDSISSPNQKIKRNIEDADRVTGLKWLAVTIDTKRKVD